MKKDNFVCLGSISVNHAELTEFQRKSLEKAVNNLAHLRKTTDAIEFLKTQREKRHKVVDSILKNKFGEDSDDEFEFVLEDE